jgi:hypothetical protein
MDLRKSDRATYVELSRKNLESLLAKLNGNPAISACTIERDTNEGYLIVHAVEDSVAYADRPAGAMHEDTEAAVNEFHRFHQRPDGTFCCDAPAGPVEQEGLVELVLSPEPDGSIRIDILGMEGKPPGVYNARCVINEGLGTPFVPDNEPPFQGEFGPIDVGGQDAEAGS